MAWSGCWSTRSRTAGIVGESMERQVTNHVPHHLRENIPTPPHCRARRAAGAALQLRPAGQRLVAPARPCAPPLPPKATGPSYPPRGSTPACAARGRRRSRPSLCPTRAASWSCSCIRSCRVRATSISVSGCRGVLASLSGRSNHPWCCAVSNGTSTPTRQRLMRPGRSVAELPTLRWPTTCLPGCGGRPRPCRSRSGPEVDDYKMTETALYASFLLRLG